MSGLRAVQFGAGNIGRGFMGQLFWEAGYDTTFVDRKDDTVSLLNSRGAYPLRLLDAYSQKEIDLTIDRLAARASSDVEGVASAFAASALVATAVGVENLNDVAPLVAAGVQKRYERSGGPLDIYLCENILGAGDLLKKAVVKLLDDELAEWTEKNIGFVGTSVARMVPAPSDRFGVNDPLFVVADSYHQLPYDGMACRAPQPPISGMRPVGNFQAEVQRKLYTHNLGHAVLGFVGYLRAHSFVHEALSDSVVSSIFKGALEETSTALAKMYPNEIDSVEQSEICSDVRIRFGNPMLLDTVSRVARDPLRKLAAGDRLIGSAAICTTQGIFPKNVSFACAAALHYDAADDPAAVRLQRMIDATGVAQTLQTVSGVDPESDFGREVLIAYRELEGWKAKQGPGHMSPPRERNGGE